MTWNPRLYALLAYLLFFALVLTLGLATRPEPARANPSIDNLTSGSPAFQGGAPSAVDDVGITPEDTPISLTVLSNDSGTNLFISAIGAAQHGTNAMSGASAVYTPALNFAGTDSFTYTASDGALTSTARVTVTVTPGNDAPLIGLTKILYDGALGGTPNNQGFIYAAIPGAGASNTASGGVTTLDTTLIGNGTKAGYWGTPPLVPPLNRATGYTLRFLAHVVSENHSGSDKNGDGVEDRAGFSVIAISSDGQRGIELGFWSNQIWAQNGGAAQPPPNSNTLFTHGESAAFNTTAGLIPYELRVLGGAYSLVVSNTEILSGSLRDYTAFNDPTFDFVYKTPSSIFLGDDTGSARAQVKLSHISVITNATLPDRAGASNSSLVIDKLGFLDVDAGGKTVVVAMTVNSGVLTLTTTAPGGLTAAQISGNGTKSVVATGPLGQINSTLGFTPALIYRSNPNFFGLDPATLTINDQGHSGGGALIGQKSFNITVQAADLRLVKTANNLTPQPGERITYTLVVSNAGNLKATNGLIKDYLPAGLTFAGPVSLEPAGAGSAGTPPNLVTNLTLTAGHRLTVTFPVTVNTHLNSGNLITNSATVTSSPGDVNAANNTGTVAVTVHAPTTPLNATFLPIIIKGN